ncbi:MAG: radical SAM protein [Candidatus Marinimicrobia bacterium]|nr:radical SAM protein [Candidatus Neomarinimicrobiota bacterium]
MLKIKNITGLGRLLFILRVKGGVALHYFSEMVRGQLDLGQTYRLLRRLNYFIGQLSENKFIRIGKYIRLNLYIPGFPSRAFFTACDKFKVFDEKFPNTTVLLSVTRACRYHCHHCYQKNDQGKDLDIGILKEITQKLQNMGVAFFNIEGGEPFLVFDRLKQVCEVIDGRSEIWVNSTGDGVTLEALQELKKLSVTAIMFSLHSSDPDKLNNFMGMETAWNTMTEAIKNCHKADIVVAFNICLQKEDFYNGEFERIMERAREFKAAIIQLIHPKPAGGWLERGVEPFSPADLQRVKDLVHRYNHHRNFRDYPAISAQINEEDSSMFGCTAGGTDRFYINAAGEVQPCEFLNASFGNVNDEKFEEIYQKMRKTFEIPGEKWLCQEYSKEIFRLCQENNLKNLPLKKELFAKIYENWNRGNATRLYQKLRQL